MAAAGDRLSPILVKELRQGVRGHLFTGAFLLQVLLLLAVGSLSLLVDMGPGNREVYTFFFWAFVTIPLVIILPLGAGVSISGELAANTLEPLLLTRLSAWRLVAGKWAASASQALVLGTAALPFVLVRYYLGGVEVVPDLAFLAAYVTCSLLLASVAVALSPARLSGLFRWALMVGLSLLLGISYLATLGSAAYERVFTHGASGQWLSVLGFLAVVACSVLAALEGAALQLAPAAMARPLRLRVLALTALAIAAIMPLGPMDDITVVSIVWAGSLALVTAVVALCEPVHLLRARYAGFFRKRVFVPLAWFLAPGWPAGVGFVLVLAAAAAGVTAAHQGPRAGALVLGGLLGSLLLPLVVWRTFFPRAPSFLLVLLVTLASAACSTVAPIALNSGSLTFWWKAGGLLLPLCPIAYALGRLDVHGHGISPASLLPALNDALFVGFVCLVTGAALWHTVRAWREIGRAVRQPPPP